MKEFLIIGAKQPYFKFVPSFIFYLQYVMTLPLQKNKIEKGKQQQYRKKGREGGKRARRRELAKAEIFGMLTRNRAVSQAQGSLMSHSSTQEAEGGFQQFQCLQVSSSSV